ncbi:MAG: hypothetical protein HUU20_16485 [Pirellulales bacterium]|nr:hypothetical protein [Pirellulales bacterium]
MATLSQYLDSELAKHLSKRSTAARKTLRDVLLSGCQSAVDGMNRAGDPADPVGVLVTQGAAVLVLAAWLAEDVRAGGESLEKATVEKVAAMAGKHVPEFRLMAELHGLVAEQGDLVADDCVYCRLRQYALRFQAALLPTPLRYHFRDLAVLRARLRNFCEHYDAGHEAIGSQARARLVENGCDPEAAGYLVKRLAEGLPDRLLTYTAREYAAIAEQSRQWYPLVRFLAERDYLPGPDRDEIEGQLKELCARLQQAVRRRGPHRDFAAAAAEAIRTAVETAANPVVGYTFEEDFFHWLFKKAVNHARRRADHRSLESENLPGQPGFTIEQYLGALVRQRGRFGLVLTFFHRRTRKVLVRIWQHMLDGSPTSDEELAAEISAKLEWRVAPRTLSGYRRRIRQKMAALRYAMDEEELDPDGADGAPDAAMFAYVESHFGDVAPSLRSALCQLGALGRLARRDGTGDYDEDTVRWARFARLLVGRPLGRPGRRRSHGIGKRRFRKIVSQSLRGLKLGKAAPQLVHEVRQRKARAAQWLGRNPDGPAECRRSLGRRWAWLASPCWYAAVLLQWQPSKTLATFRLGTAEAAAIEKALEVCRCEAPQHGAGDAEAVL